MAETLGTSHPQSETEHQLLQTATYMIEKALEIQAWSGCLDWSKRLTAEGVLATPALKRAFSTVKRVDFLPNHQKPDEGYDLPLQVGYDQTNSQPSLVAKMLELLEPRKGNSVLDVGSGSGWTTGLLASSVGNRGKVMGVERIPELVNFSRQNLEKYKFPSAAIEQAQSCLGLPAGAPYNRILVSAHMLPDWIPELGEQLSPRGGIMVAPIVSEENYGKQAYTQKIVVITRRGARFSKQVADVAVAFVPLVKPVV